MPPPLAFLFLPFCGWINRQQQDVIEYLLEKNRILRAAHGLDTCASPMISGVA